MNSGGGTRKSENPGIDMSAPHGTSHTAIMRRGGSSVGIGFRVAKPSRTNLGLCPASRAGLSRRRLWAAAHGFVGRWIAPAHVLLPMPAANCRPDVEAMKPCRLGIERSKPNQFGRCRPKRSSFPSRKIGRLCPIAIDAKGRLRGLGGDDIEAVKGNARQSRHGRDLNRAPSRRPRRRSIGTSPPHEPRYTERCRLQLNQDRPPRCSSCSGKRRAILPRVALGVVHKRG